MTDISAFCFDRESPLVILPDILSFQFHSIQFRSLPFNSVHFVNVLHFILFHGSLDNGARPCGFQANEPTRASLDWPGGQPNRTVSHCQGTFADELFRAACVH